MTTPRLPRKCARTCAELAAELGKTWAFAKPEPGRQQRHAASAAHFHQTADIIEFPPTAADLEIGCAR